MKKRQLLAIISIICLLTAVFFWGDINKKLTSLMPNKAEQNAGLIDDMASSNVNTPDDNQDNKHNGEIQKSPEGGNLSGEDPVGEPEKTADSEIEYTKKENINTVITANGDKKPTNEDKKPICTLSITCETVLDNMHLFDMDKSEVLPKNGIIYKVREVTFSEGDSVFDILLKETKKNKIHMDFTADPISKNNYVKGINNLYEFDCGGLSGWRYRVNGQFPNCGCNQYMPENGDVIEWIYSCDLGDD
ncbi:MAG TPA: DUF4430 domain-containing protein [Clostridia bacterium]|nr:DUF4430 domain-containing protein [Clostridia bacterium]